MTFVVLGDCKRCLTKIRLYLCKEGMMEGQDFRYQKLLSYLRRIV